MADLRTMTRWQARAIRLSLRHIDGLLSGPTPGPDTVERTRRLAARLSARICEAVDRAAAIRRADAVEADRAEREAVIAADARDESAWDWEAYLNMPCGEEWQNIREIEAEIEADLWEDAE
jgi:hypothetical protein